MVDFLDVMKAVKQLTPDEKSRLMEYLQHEKDISAPKKTRRAGLHEHLGHAWMSEDFNAELPDSFWLGDA